MHILVLLLVLTSRDDIRDTIVIGTAADQVDCAEKAAAAIAELGETATDLKDVGLHLAVRCVNAEPRPVVKGTRIL